MKINLLAFGIAKDILGWVQSSYTVDSSASIADLKRQLSVQFPMFEKLSKFDIAVNQEYQSDDFKLSEEDEIAIIPPVSGG